MMNMQKLTKLVFLLIIATFLLVLGSCSINQQKEKVVNIDELLPKEAIIEITTAHPDFKIALVEKEDANVSLKVNQRYLQIDGIEDEETRERIAKYIIQYIENPNKKAEGIAKRKAYDELPPQEKLDSFVERMKGHYPKFEYKWVGLGKGNVKVEYGDNSLIINGIENDGTREEIAYGITQLQKELDKLSKEEQN